MDQHDAGAVMLILTLASTAGYVATGAATKVSTRLDQVVTTLATIALMLSLGLAGVTPAATSSLLALIAGVGAWIAVAAVHRRAR
jgi:hypothetical protein